MISTKQITKRLLFSHEGSLGIIAGFYMTGIFNCNSEDCPSLVTMAMTRNGNVSTVVLILFISLWLFMLVTSLQVFCIAVKSTRNNAVEPTCQGPERHDETRQQENVQKLHFGITKQLRKVRGLHLNFIKPIISFQKITSYLQ